MKTNNFVRRNILYTPDYTQVSCAGARTEGGLRCQGVFKIPLPDKPLLSVVTVVLNGEKSIEQLILSILNQPYDNIEYIVIDGCSSDRTVEILKKFDDRIDYWVSERDNGIYDAMNKAIDIARGNWLYFIGFDDVALPGLSQMIETVKDEHKIYYGDVEILSSGAKSAGRFSKYKLMQQNICHQAILYPAILFKEYKYNTQYTLLADYHLNILTFSRFEFVYIPCTVALFDDNGLSSKSDIAFTKDKHRLILENFGLCYFAVKLIRTALASIYKLILNKFT